MVTWKRLYSCTLDELKINMAPDFQHRIYTLANDGKLFSAPIDESCQNILDVACGTGIWAIEVGMSE